MPELLSPLSERTDALHRLLTEREGELVSSKEIHLAVGKGWRDAVAELQRRGVVIESTVGASGNWSFRVPAPPKPKPLDQTGWPINLASQMASWVRANSMRPSGVVLPFHMEAATVLDEARALDLVVFHGSVERPLFVVEAHRPMVEHESPRPRPDGLY